MWWIYAHASHIILLWYSATLMPHYTIAFRPLFEFIILGIIPGTNVRLEMSGTLIIVLTSLLVFSIALYHPKSVNNKPYSSIYDISL